MSIIEQTRKVQERQNKQNRQLNKQRKNLWVNASDLEIKEALKDWERRWKEANKDQVFYQLVGFCFKPRYGRRMNIAAFRLATNWSLAFGPDRRHVFRWKLDKAPKYLTEGPEQSMLCRMWDIMDHRPPRRFLGCC